MSKKWLRMKLNKQQKAVEEQCPNLAVPDLHIAPGTFALELMNYLSVKQQDAEMGTAAGPCEVEE